MGAAGQPPEYNPQPYLAELDWLRAGGDSLKSRAAVEFLVTGLLAVSIAIVYSFIAVREEWSWWIVPAGFLTLVVSGGIAVPVAFFHDLAVTKSRLRFSGLFDALAWGQARDYAPLATAIDKQFIEHHEQPLENANGQLQYIADNLRDMLFTGRSFADIDTSTLDRTVSSLATFGFMLTIFLISSVNQNPDDSFPHVLFFVTILSACIAITRFRLQRGRLHHILADYFEEQHAAVIGKAQPRISPATAGLHRMFNQLEDDLHKGNQTLVVTTLFLSVLPVIAMCLLLNSAWMWALSDAEKFVAVVFEVITSFLVFFMVPYFMAHSQSRALTAQLGNSDLLVRVITGDQPTHDIALHVPGLLRHNLSYPKMPDGYRNGLAEVLWNIGYNLDWYLRPSRWLVRPGWFTGPILIAVMCILLINLLGPPVILPIGELQATIAILAPAAICILILVHDVSRKVRWTRLLIRHLRELVG